MARNYDENYLDGLIAKAKKSWEGVDVERYMSDLRDDSFDKEVAENLSKEVASYITEQMKSNMKTIEERAKEWGEHIVETTPYDVVNGKACVFVEDRNIADVAEESYIAGATEQKAIDEAKLLKLKSAWEKEAQINHDDEANRKQGYHDAIDKACEWLEKELQKIAVDEVKENFLENNFNIILKSQVPNWLTDFRKAMEE